MSSEELEGVFSGGKYKEHYDLSWVKLLRKTYDQKAGEVKIEMSDGAE